MPDPNVLHLDSSEDFEDGLTASVSANGRIAITVADQQSVDSRNQLFECTATLTRDQAAELRDWLSAHLTVPTEGAAA